MKSREAKYRKYSLENNSFAYIDVSEKQINYSSKLSDSADFNQFNFFNNLDRQNIFRNRINMECVHDNKIVVLENLNSVENNKMYGYDGIITGMNDVPLFLASGDCLTMAVAGKNAIGISHCSLKTIDKNIVNVFLDEFSKLDKLEDLVFGFGPYIFKKDYSYDYLNLNRKDLWNFVEDADNKFYLDLRGMVLNDLCNRGIPNSQIKDFKINTYDLSKKSLSLGGFQVSHKHYFDNPKKEGRLGMFVIKDSSCR